MLTRRCGAKAGANETGEPGPRLASHLIRPIALFCGVPAVLTIFWPDWIEALTGFDPDEHDGTVEWLIVIGLLSTAPYWGSRRAPNGAVPGRRLSSLD